MKSLIRACILCMAVLSLLISDVSGSSDVLIEADYESIVNEYRDAIASDTDSEALSHLRTLCRYYESPGRAEALETYESGTATVYYTYARGIIAFRDGNYSDSLSQFEVLQGAKVDSGLADVPPLPDTTYYYKYSQAMLYFQAGDYENAFIDLEEARTAESASVVTCRNAKRTFADALKQEAQECCNAGDHVTAQAYYRLYAQYVSSIEGQAMLKECVEHSQTAALSIVSAEPSGTDSIALAWTGSTEAYRVCWTSDLSGTSGVSAQIIQGNNAELTSLLPGTEYRITVEPASPETVIPVAVVQPEPGTQDMAEVTVSTLSADKYPSGKLKYEGSSVVGMSQLLLKKGITPQQVFYYNESYRRESNDNSFSESDLASYELICLVSYSYTSDEAITVPVTCILRSPSSGAFRSEAKEYEFPNSGLCVSFDELLSMAEDAHSSLAKEEYAWEIYLDGMLFCKGTFSIN